VFTAVDEAVLANDRHARPARTDRTNVQPVRTVASIPALRLILVSYCMLCLCVSTQQCTAVWETPTVQPPGQFPFRTSPNCSTPEGDIPRPDVKFCYQTI